ncbi:MAG: hypothetical protein A2Z37_01385 [Chloroflexi bacterium RBG_19FT_COMBO_62_14]|nr:MAG: hypothetical protein A2Z37_01385 [Chloroflexi bacterium RBG_19FT_COMBO_62_14]
MIEGVIFDLGSTLIRFEGDWETVVLEGRMALVQSLLSTGLAIDGDTFSGAFQMELETSLRERQEDFVERPASSVLRKVLEQFGVPDTPDELVGRALRDMFAVSEAHWVLMPGAHAVLQELQRDSLRLGVISNASDTDDVNRLIDASDLRRYFEPILISAEVGRRKPDPSLFETVLRKWSLAPARVVMVGDTLSQDILGAQKAGLRQIWLTTQADTPLNRAYAGQIIPEAAAAELAEIPLLIRRMSQDHDRDAV